MNSEVDKLEKALKSLSIGEGEVVNLAKVLAYASKASTISYNDVKKTIGNYSEDTLLLANEYRLLIPMKTSKSAAWEDKVLIAEPEEEYEMPNVVKHLVENGSQTGRWNPNYAITEVFKEMGEETYGQMSKLVERLGEETENYKVNAFQIKDVCDELGLEDKVSSIIAELKGGGIMSPKLGSLAEVSKAGSPIYELNPSLIAELEK